MSAISRRFGWYLALLQLLITLCWTVYAIYLPKLAASAGIPPGAVILLLMLDQAIFTVCDFAIGVAADKVKRVMGRLGKYVVIATAVSCAAFIAIPFVAGTSTTLLIVATLVWIVTSSALRAPPMKLLGKYAAKSTIPYLTSLAMLGTGIAGALAPYLAITLRDVDPRVPFAMASIVLAIAALGMISAERMLANAPQPEPKSPPPRSFGTMTTPAIVFALGMIVLALGYQMHIALASTPLFARFVPPGEVQWLMPVFSIAFSISMFPASKIVNRFGGYTVMGVAGLIGALAILGANFAQGLGMLVVAQAAVGAAWGAILMSAFTVAFAIGANGGEGRMSGLLFSVLALATFTRMAMVASGLSGEPTLQAVLQWIPTLCWAIAGAVLLYLAVKGMQRLTTAKPT